MHLVFYDAQSPTAYSDASLSAGDSGIGGSEATVVRVARALAADHDVVVAQRHRPDGAGERSAGVTWLSLRDARGAVRGADAVVVLRRTTDGLRVRRLTRRARLLLWHHDWHFPASAAPTARARRGAELRAHVRVLVHALCGMGVVAVSHAHAANVRDSLGSARWLRRWARRVPVQAIHNPTPEAAAPAATTIDLDKMVYASAPWKGLDQVLTAFAAVREAVPSVQLHVAAPPYVLQGTPVSAEGVVPRGRLSPQQLHEEIAGSLCVFYPASAHPETFGLVFTESHSLGTPVLAHPFGAAPELLGEEELVDAADLDAVVARVRAWRGGGRPEVSLDPALRLPAVLAAWQQLLSGRSTVGAGSRA